jgi:sugar lactone lactonase YvrE
MSKNAALLLALIPLMMITGLSADAHNEWAPTESTGDLVIAVEGFSGPEAVWYDPDQDVYFVSNFNGEVSGDANAFVSKVSADGEIIELKFMTGTEAAPFHGGRGMFIVDDSLWVADADGIHQFDRHSGQHLNFVDFSGLEPGFPNDITQGPDGNLYVTDTGNSVLYRVEDGTVTIATALPFAANGITTNPANGRLIMVPWSGALEFVEWDVYEHTFTTIGATAGGGNYDGVEVLGKAIISACQVDTSLHVMVDGADARVVDLPGKPADIAIDTKRYNVDVPYVALHLVEIRTLK